MDQLQLQKMKSGKGFIAALDQSGGSTPKALSLYGIPQERYSTDEEMFELMHAMRSRIITSPAFNGDRVIGAILFEKTMDSQIDGQYSGDYLWNAKQVVPFLKIDKGLESESDGVQLMKPIPNLASLLERANERHIFGTKERSVIKLADTGGIKAIVDQQFEVARDVLAAGLVPIIEPEVDIHSPEKSEAEKLLTAAITERLGELGPDQHVMLKLTLPDTDDLYDVLVQHPQVVRVVALSGGYSREEACERLARCKRVIASFSRALTEGLSADQSDDEFNRTLDASVESIYRASIS